MKYNNRMPSVRDTSGRGKDTTNESPIVIVYLNNKLPKYARKNIKYLSETFPERSIYIVSNNLVNISLGINSKNVRTFYLNDFQKEISKIEETSNLPTEFRNGFWITTIARFIALEKFMHQLGINSLFHIEADVLLFKNFPFDCEAFQSTKLAFPYVSENMAAASVFFVGDVSSLIDFNKYILNAIASNSSVTDMGILANYGNERNDKVVKLYTGFGSSSLFSMQYLFDAATIGMYLTGQDPRNSKGFLKTYFEIQDHSLKPSEIDFKYNSENVIIANLSNTKYILTNLHIHSKQRKYFSSKKSSSNVRKTINRRNKKEHIRFSLEIWIEMAFNYLIRRVKSLFY